MNKNIEKIKKIFQENKNNITQIQEHNNISNIITFKLNNNLEIIAHINNVKTLCYVSFDNINYYLTKNDTLEELKTIVIEIISYFINKELLIADIAYIDKNQKFKDFTHNIDLHQEIYTFKMSENYEINLKKEYNNNIKTIEIKNAEKYFINFFELESTFQIYKYKIKKTANLMILINYIVQKNGKTIKIC